MRYREPPIGLTREEWWAGTSMTRRSIEKPLPLIGRDGQPFRFVNVEPIQEMLHHIDQKASGQILADDVVTNLRGSDRYLINSLVEEAITSSQLEGASTTRKVAKEMLQTGRRPRDRSEQMILNNFNAMLHAEQRSRAPFSPEDVLELHRLVTLDTLRDPNDSGRLQSPDDTRVFVTWLKDGTMVHRPPSAEQLPERLDALCRFASGQATDGFIHPVVRAIIVHFWLAYDHPFVDGNGRTARALFYWTMLNEGYWLTQYLSISSILRRAPNQYAKSYLYAETDSNDLTYFVVYQLGVIVRSIESLHTYLRRKISETKEIERLVYGVPELNHRQILVIGDALRDPHEPFTITAQARRNRVTYESARSDLTRLVTLGLFRKDKVGKKHIFRPEVDLSERLRQLSERR